MKTTHAVLGGAALIAVSILVNAYILTQISTYLAYIHGNLHDVSEELRFIREFVISRWQY